MGIPNILNLYIRPSITSTACFNAISSEPKVELSSVFCLLENQITGTIQVNNDPSMGPSRDFISSMVGIDKATNVDPSPNGSGISCGLL